MEAAADEHVLGGAVEGGDGRVLGVAAEDGFGLDLLVEPPHVHHRDAVVLAVAQGALLDVVAVLRRADLVQRVQLQLALRGLDGVGVAVGVCGPQ